ncbi:hypothetical protein DSO57_1023446 [Entomophthora muscae]|uniref:Uncharacterized protein n=1 Tax=Entomophthora muscae TaxID=34485 RepID=A0ACC2RHL0_9FUNG|nr:hypothetical protein DSO57_1023446 [Entomophthora muscae]
MSACNNIQPSLCQVYQDLMAGIMVKDFAGQDCDTTVAGSERGTVTHVEGEEEVDSIFAETEAPLIQLPCLGFEDLQYWSDNIVLKTAASPLATPSVLLCACCNSGELPSTYPAIIN